MSASNIERFSRGESITVEVGRIERELAALWQDASRAEAPASDREAHVLREHTALSRAALWNIIVPAHGAESLRWTRELVDEMAPSVPARVIVLCRDADDEHSSGGSGETLRASIGSNVVSRPSGARTVYSEEIILTGRGGAEEHFGALVRALQIPSLPTAIFWIDSTLTETLLTRELLPVSERLVVDTGRCRNVADLRSIERILDLCRLDIADLGWARLDNFRLLFAGLFDPPVGGDPLGSATRVVVRHRPHSLVSGLLLIAWLAGQMKWEMLDSKARPQGQRQLYFRRPNGAGGESDGGGKATETSPLVLVELVPSHDSCGTSGIVAIELTSATGERYAVTRTAQNHAKLEIPIAPARSVKLDSRSTAELCIAAVGPRGRDPLMRRCLTLAARLGERLEPGTTP
jgi:glucose-6-phosphate dehydrogenase assembly protein OpcA